jgi:hypothetical protein
VATIEGFSFSTSIIALDAQGDPAASARVANSLYVTWFFHNSSSHAVDLVFPQARMFMLAILDDAGNHIWDFTPPPPAPDYVVTVLPNGNFSVPDSADQTVPPQVPSIPLANITAAGGVAIGMELYVRMTVPLFGGDQAITTRLWR